MAVSVPPQGDLASAKAEARRLRENAKMHKRAQDSHRRKSRDFMARLAELEARWGMRLITEDDVPNHSPSPRRPSEHDDQEAT